MDHRLVKTSRQLSWLLRHGAPTVGVAVDAAGWARIDDVLRHLRIARPELDEVVRENNKQRLQVEGDRIRCCQGHSTEDMPVTQAALEASWQRWAGEGPIWHGTAVSALEGIAAEGIRPVKRTHVHLAAALDSVVGKRAAVDVMLRVSVEHLRANALEVYEAPNGVLLTRAVPPDCITGLEPRTRRTRNSSAQLWAHFVERRGG